MMPPPRPPRLSTNSRQVPISDEPSSPIPGDEGQLARSLGAAFGGLTGGVLPLHRQISEVTSITHSGYLFKRSNKPYQQVSPFPVHSLEISVDVDDTTNHFDSVPNGGLVAEITPILNPKPSSLEDAFSRESLTTFATTNGDNNHLQQSLSHRPLHLETDDPSYPALPTLVTPPLVPLWNDITGSISTKATDRDDFQTETPSDSQAARKAALEESLNCAAAFFGFGLEAAFQPVPLVAQAAPSRVVTNDTDTNVSASDIIADFNGDTPQPQKQQPQEQSQRQHQQTRSAPIKVNATRDSTGSFGHNIQRRCSAPCVYDNHASPGGEDGTLNSTRSRPSDYVDPKDGHLWRSKYCVLEDGILYFYRNAGDADAQEAKKERQSSGLLTDDTFAQPDADAAADLSRSPMASRSCIVLPGFDGTSVSGSNSDAESNFMWEKRVALNCVGAVRSAETEYGVNAFELLAVDDDDDGFTNKLVLKAPKPDDMSEWLFQFHRSLASFVRNMVDLVGATPSYALGDIHHPAFQLEPLGHVVQSPLRSFNLPACSPRFLNKHMQSPSVAALSHGHGRSQLRRRRADFGSKGLSSQSVHSVPTTPMSQSPTQLPFPLSHMTSTKSNLAAAVSNASLVTPLKHGGDLMLPEADSEPRQAPEIDDSSPPELSAPKSANPPETDRPPAPASGSKYVAPHLRKKGAYVPPHLRNKDPKEGAAKPAPKKYVPPHLRNKNSSNGTDNSNNIKSNILGPRSLSLAEKERVESAFASSASNGHASVVKEDEWQGKTTNEPEPAKSLKLGGCADPQVIDGSILDSVYIPRKASRVGKVPTNAYGGFGGVKTGDGGPESEPEIPASSLQWEIGAVSECGIRETNEDSYLVTNNVVETFSDLLPGSLRPTYWHSAHEHQSGLFCVFDGHGGNQAARFAAEKLPRFLYDESLDHDPSIEVDPATTEEILRRAIRKLDDAFCQLCVEDEREWESGSTALIATLVNGHLVIASLGDCRGVLSRLVEDGQGQHASLAEQNEWNELDAENGVIGSERCFWREVAEVHSPSRKDEKERIEQAGGWTTTEKEIPISQLQRMDFCDEDVIGILKRCLQGKYDNSQSSKECSSAPQRILHISRVCGELAVSRAIGDRDFKAACNNPSIGDTGEEKWECTLFLPFPDDHDRHFVGDLVSGKPDFSSIRVGEAGIQGEFLLLACDGLWDVIDVDDAVRVTRGLLFEKKLPAKQAAARLAELAIHLGSSDNVTIIVVNFTSKA
ncbi:linked kinase-associated serine/threonine phosphatase 2C [Seminavis robusta]|uniref:Linked kinase-associated serine/threonine phosphatase 2C n=1 Tax=Seminavis robusta TaxID=568900 RepID=A0A9N8H1R8_9STRA|nr:linked kinase-associated serine/threonine phosphatase 2C [Seminavis robusta]|eukprot:Sro47_g027830.1 linked kinase-associated serine/threonine phosphatase 2C (1249) ;mRNA; f:74746-79073